MKDEIEFIEEKIDFSSPTDNKIYENSLEGWVYKKIPGSIAVKRYILLCLILFIFIVAGVIFLLAHSNNINI